MNKAYQPAIIGVVIILAFVGILFGSGALSIIGEGVSEQCRINMTTKSCTIELTLPEYRSVQTYTLDAQFFSVPGAYQSEIQVTPIVGVGPLYEEDDMDESSSLQELETNYLYLYRLPTNWNVDEIYSVKADITVPGWIQKTSATYGDIDISSYFGVVDYPYTPNTVLKCGESNCDTNVHLVRHYDKDYSRSPNEWKYYEYNLAQKSVRDYVSGDDLDSNDNEYEDFHWLQRWDGFVVVKGEFILQDVMDEYGITNPTTELMMYVHVDIDEREKGYVNGGVTVPPEVHLSYAAEQRPTNTILTVGTVDVQTFSGQPENVTTQDIASAINNYCETRAVGDKCTVPITFKSMEDGIIKVIAESGQLRATSQETGRSGGNLLTGFAFADIGEFAGNSFDFEGHATQAWITSGILFLLVFGLVFLIGGKKK